MLGPKRQTALTPIWFTHLAVQSLKMGLQSAGILFFGFWCLVAWLGKKWGDYEMYLVERRGGGLVVFFWDGTGVLDFGEHDVK